MLIFCLERESNIIWAKNHEKTRNISAVNTSLKELIVNIDSIKRDLPPLRYSLKDPFVQFKNAYQEYH